MTSDLAMGCQTPKALIMKQKFDLIKIKTLCQVRWWLPAVPILRRKRQKDKVILNYTESLRPAEAIWSSASKIKQNTKQINKSWHAPMSTNRMERVCTSCLHIFWDSVSWTPRSPLTLCSQGWPWVVEQSTTEHIPFQNYIADKTHNRL